jgi:hypothetical protein
MKVMPNREEHCLHSYERYGIRGDDIHSWIDEPSQILGGSHRNERHDVNSLDTAIRMFGNKYGDDAVRQIFLDHLYLDSKEKQELQQQSTENKLNTAYVPSQPKTLFGLKEAKLLWSLSLAFGIGTTALFSVSVLDSGEIGFLARQNWLYFVLFSIFCFVIAGYYYKKW